MRARLGLVVLWTGALAWGALVDVSLGGEAWADNAYTNTNPVRTHFALGGQAQSGSTTGAAELVFSGFLTGTNDPFGEGYADDLGERTLTTATVWGGMHMAHGTVLLSAALPLDAYLRTNVFTVGLAFIKPL